MRAAKFIRLGAALIGLSAASRCAAEVLYGSEALSSAPYSSSLVSFDTSNPGTLLSNIQINGADLGTPQSGNPNGQQFVINGIDFRPLNSTLYGLGFRSGFEQRVYTIDPATGAATKLPNGPFVSASSASFNFDPVRDVIRLTSDQRANAHIDPVTGSTTTDTAPVYASGDVNFGQTPRIGGAAYTNHLGGASSTTLYGIDERGTGNLVTIGTPGNAASADGGQLRTVGPLNLGFTIPTDELMTFFISPYTGNAYAALENGSFFSGTPSHLYQINLSTGAATDLGQIGPNGTVSITGLTAVPEPGSVATIGLIVGLMGRRGRKK